MIITDFLVYHTSNSMMALIALVVFAVAGGIFTHMVADYCRYPFWLRMILTVISGVIAALVATLYANRAHAIAIL